MPDGCVEIVFNLGDSFINADTGERQPRDHLARVLPDWLHATGADSITAVDEALSIIDASRGIITIESVAQRVGITRRHLERQFREHVGLGAKHIARIARIHSALDLMQAQPEMSGAEIAVTCGYSDQAHLIRECQQLAGQTPQRLKTTERSLAGLMREAV